MIFFPFLSMFKEYRSSTNNNILEQYFLVCPISKKKVFSLKTKQSVPIFTFFNRNFQLFYKYYLIVIVYGSINSLFVHHHR